MKLCPNCQKTYPDDANFCPEESCATPDGPRRLVAAAAAAPAPAAARFSPHTRIGGSSTGEVFIARDNQTGQDVAYKIVAPEVVGNDTVFARVEREFKQLAKLGSGAGSSPRMASVIECERTADGRLAVALELCPGAETLEQILRRGPLPLDRAKNIVSQIGQALLEAQKAGLVHRDLAPKNVLVLSTGDVKLINFPLAKPIPGGDDKVAGVAAYLSPEQAQGKAPDQRSNTYSLACVLYHMLTGEPPFAGADAKSVLDLHQSSPPLPPSQRRPDAALSPDADKVILKALDKNSSRRHLTLRLFLTEVEALSAAAAAAPKAGGGEVGFAKTMLFAGGQAEVQKMVANAIAARAAQAGGKSPTAGPAATAPAPDAPAPAPAPVAPMVAPTAVIPPAVVAAAAAQVPPAGPVDMPPAITPSAPEAPPVSNNVKDSPGKAPEAPIAKPAAAAGGGAAGGKGAAFRETLWFKKGDVEQLVAEAKAKAAATGKKLDETEAVSVATASEEVKPLEDRYVDDGTVTTDDRKKFSLRTGGTATAMPAASRSVMGDKMSDAEMVSELGGGKKKIFMIVGAAIVAIGIIAAIASMSGKKEPAKPAAAPAAAAAAPAPAPPPAAAAKPADPPPTAEEPAKPAAEAKPAVAEKPEEKKRAAARKKPDKKRKR